jgi:hypothetical protein
MLKLLSAELDRYRRALFISGFLRALILSGVGVALLRNTPSTVVLIYGAVFVAYIFLEMFSIAHKQWAAGRLVAYAEEKMKIPIHEPVGHKRKFALEDEPEQKSIERKE